MTVELTRVDHVDQLPSTLRSVWPEGTLTLPLPFSVCGSSITITSHQLVGRGVRGAVYVLGGVSTGLQLWSVAAVLRRHGAFHLRSFVDLASLHTSRGRALALARDVPVERLPESDLRRAIEASEIPDRYGDITAFPLAGLSTEPLMRFVIRYVAALSSYLSVPITASPRYDESGRMEPVVRLAYRMRLGTTLVDEVPLHRIRRDQSSGLAGVMSVGAVLSMHLNQLAATCWRNDVQRRLAA